MPRTLSSPAEQFDSPEKSSLGELPLHEIMDTKAQVSAILTPETTQEVLAPVTFGEMDIVFGTHGKKMTHHFKNGRGVLEVNQSLFTSPEEAVRHALGEAAYIGEVRKKMMDTRDTLMNVEKEISAPKDLPQVLRWKGVRTLCEFDPENAQKLMVPTSHVFPSLEAEFMSACSQRLLTGNFPSDLSLEVKNALDKIPQKDGKTPLESIASEMKDLKTSVEMYQKYIAPRRVELREKDRERTKTSSDTFKPAMDDKEDEEVMDEKDIHQRIYPFFGGYYRERVCHSFSTKTNELLILPVASTLWREDLPEGKEEEKKYFFQGDVQSSLPLRLPLPSKNGIPAFPLSSTLNPHAFFDLYRDEDGCFYLHAKSGKVIPKGTPYAFEFIFASNLEEVMLKEEEAMMIEGVREQLSPETQEFLDEVKGSYLSSLAKTGKICAYVRKNLKYSMKGVLSDYYHAHPKGFFAGIEEKKEADCDVANTYFLALLREVGIPSRQAQGYYVQKDPRFEFAALAGAGHAWTEMWDGKSWIRFDATPPGEQEEGEENEENESQEGDAGGGDSGEVQDEYSLEEIMKLYEEMMEAPEKTPEERVSELFEKDHGVSLKDWERVEKYIAGVNKLVIPREQTIEKTSESTLEKEWSKLFELIYERRKKPVEVFKGPVKQSEGDFLDDPTDAYIDLVAGEEDVMGFKLAAMKEKMHVLVRDFEDDYILDLTQSMEGDKLEAQRQLVLASTYNIMKLNERLGLTKYREQMKEPIIVKSHLLTFEGDTKVTLEHRREDAINEKELVSLEKSLEKTVSGGGNLLGALQEYERSLTPELLQKLKMKKLAKILTVITDGAVPDSDQASQTIRSLRTKGIVVQGIGFGNDARDIMVICHDPRDPDAAVVLSDVKGAVLARHKMLIKRLKTI